MALLPKMNLSALRAVEAVARLGSLRLAADELGVTPGAVSQRILKAEAQLERRLFERTQKGLVPTSIGQDLSSHLTDGFSTLARGIALSQAKPEDAVTISVAPVFAAKWLVRRLGQFAKLRPDIRVRIDASGAHVTPSPGDVDACIRVGRGGWPDVEVEEISPQRVFPVCAPALAEHIKEVADLSNLPIIREKKNQLFDWDVWLRPNQTSETVLGDGPVFSDASLCLDAAAAGQGVYLSLETLAVDAISTGQLVAALPGRFPTDVSYWFVEAPGTRRLPKVTAFRNWIIEAMQRGA
ncbi:Glycine cleavage system transcriptional activator [Labrenzia sp. THAF82]|uniref:LysR substrate-binding domain-containing protein n=1 Tax=Labrenzia sp. THAF82 TaxID=2587861 RepID=UPI00126956B6|nr:LysR substrate-binding domain-containing protein [Labrenzia sp. THAF82]QFT33632.1 Glycine cleavage system transcriptional activator [Labrenzia sp. THAF82]